MSLGVLNNLSAVYAENNLNNTNNSLSTVLQQLSSGKKINSGADDAAGLSLVNGLQANQTALTQSETNATEGVGLLQVADGALSQVTSLLNRAVTLATEAANGTLNSTQDTAANQEYQSILSEINNIGSTTTYNQEAVFGSNTNIYTGDSSQSGSSVDALNIRSLSSTNVGDTAGVMAYSGGANNVFLDLSNGGKNASVNDSLGTSAQTTTIQVSYMSRGANGSAVQAAANISVGAGTNYSNTAQGLINAINGAGLGLSATFGTAWQAGTAAASESTAANASGGGANDTGIIITGGGVGTGANGAGEIGTLTVGGAADMLAGALNIKDSGGNSHTITLGTANSTDTLANLASTINAAGYGITATVNANEVNGDTQGTVLTLTSASSTASVSGTNVTDASTASTTVTTTAPTSGTTSTAPGALTLATIGVNAANQTLTGTLVLDKAQAATGTSAFANSLGTGANLTTGAGAINLGVTGVTDTLANLANFINQNQVAGSNIQAVLSNGGKTLTVVNTATFTPGAAATYATVTGVGANAVNSANADALTGVPTAAGSSFSATIGTLTADSTSSKFANTGTLNIGSNAGISLGVTGSTDTLTNLAQTINTGNYGVTATLNTAGTQLTFTSANSADTFSVTGATYSGTGGAIYSTTNVASQNQIGVLNLSNTAANITTASVLAVGDKISFNNGEHVYTVNSTDGNQLGQIATAISNQGWGITATAATVSGGTYTTATLTFASNSANSQGISAIFEQGAAEAANDVISMTSDTPSVDASHYYSVGITGKVTDTTITNATTGTNGGTQNTGIVADSNGSTGVATMSYSDAAGQSLSASDLSTQSNAEAALTNLNSAIADVAAQDGYIGAQINTLSAVSNVMSTQQENLESAQNAVQATDYASASSNMSKYEILSQTGISALAQANSVQQEVTKLLQ